MPFLHNWEPNRLKRNVVQALCRDSSSTYDKTMIEKPLFAAVLCAAAMTPAHGADAWPTRPIRMIVPFSPGGTSDTMARILGQKMTEAWGQQVVVDMRPGASGAIGTEIAARAPADGHNLLHANLPFRDQSLSLYKGTVLALNDLIAGQVQLTFGAATSLPHVRSGRLVEIGRAHV